MIRYSRAIKEIPGSGCSAINGYNRNHAILGTSDHCIATHPSDLCVRTDGHGCNGSHTGIQRKTNTFHFTEFHQLPGTTPHIENVLQAGELITAIEIPALHFSNRSCYLKVRDRASYEFALASAAVALEINGGKVKQSRIAIGGVGTIPWRALEAEKQLAGTAVSKEAFRKAADIALASARPHQHNAFKTELAKRTLVRALMTASEIA